MHESRIFLLIAMLCLPLAVSCRGREPNGLAATQDEIRQYLDRHGDGSLNEDEKNAPSV